MNNECIFCKIAAGEIPAKKVYEDDSFIAFLDIRPSSKGHTLLIPKKHYETFLDMPVEEEKELFAKVQELGKKLKEKLSAQLIFLLVMGEEVPHTHIHLIPFYDTMPIGLTGKDETDLDEVLKQIKTENQNV